MISSSGAFRERALSIVRIGRMGSSPSSPTQNGSSKFEEGLVRVHNVNYLLEETWVIVKFPSMHPIQASTVAKQGLPIIKGYPISLLFVSRTMKLVGYSQESIIIVMLSIIPYG